MVESNVDDTKTNHKQKWELEIQTAIIQKIPQEPRTLWFAENDRPLRSILRVFLFTQRHIHIIEHWQR